MNRNPRLSVDALIAAGAFLLSFVVYWLTLTPSLSYNSIDGNELATVPSQMGLLHQTGYPVYTWVGKAFSLLPFGDVAYRANLLSAVSAAGTVALVSSLVVLLGRGSAGVEGLSRAQRDVALYGAAVFGAPVLAFSVTFWSQAVIAEVYTPNTFCSASRSCSCCCGASTKSRWVAAMALMRNLSGYSAPSPWCTA